MSNTERGEKESLSVVCAMHRGAKIEGRASDWKKAAFLTSEFDSYSGT